ETVRALEIPLLELVLLGVEVLLTPGLARLPLGELEGRAVDPVARGQRRRENEPRDEGGSTAVLEVLGEDVRRVRPDVRPEELALLAAGQLAEVLDQLVLRVSPGEVGVRLREPDLRQPRHHLRPRERLGEEDHVLVLTLDLAEQPLPERERLRVRVVHPEDPHALLDPEVHDAEQRLPELPPRLAPEVEGVDVLVALRRVLRELDGAVRPLPEPLRVLGDPGVIGRALEREIERDLDSVPVRRRDEPAKVVERSETRMDRGVPALFRPDRPRAAEVVRIRGERVVPALALRAADGMDRGQVQRVEAELGAVREPPLDVGEGPVPAGLVRGGAREELVPAREARTLAIDDDAKLTLVGRR